MHLREKSNPSQPGSYTQRKVLMLYDLHKASWFLGPGHNSEPCCALAASPGHMWQACGALLGHLWQLIWSHIWLATLGHAWHVYSSFIIITVLFPARGFVNLARHLYEPKKTSGLFQGQKGLEEINPLLEYQQTPEMASPFLHYGHDPEEISPVLRYLQHPEEFTVLYQKPPKSEAEIDTASQQSEEINPVLQYLQQLEEIGSNLLQRDSCLISSCPRIFNKVETVTQVKYMGTGQVYLCNFFRIFRGKQR